MATRPYDEVAAVARAQWSPPARDVAARLDRQLDQEISSGEELGRDLRAAHHSTGKPGASWITGLNSLDRPTAAGFAPPDR